MEAHLFVDGRARVARLCGHVGAFVQRDRDHEVESAYEDETQCVFEEVTDGHRSEPDWVLADHVEVGRKNRAALRLVRGRDVGHFHFEYEDVGRVDDQADGQQDEAHTDHGRIQPLVVRPARVAGNRRANA